MDEVDFASQAASWKSPRRVVANVEGHQGKNFPTGGLIVTNLWAMPEAGAALVSWAGDS
jgi:hypothetical protein